MQHACDCTLECTRTNTVIMAMCRPVTTSSAAVSYCCLAPQSQCGLCKYFDRSQPHFNVQNKCFCSTVSESFLRSVTVSHFYGKKEIHQVQHGNERVFVRLLQFFLNAKQAGVTSPEKFLPRFWVGKSDHVKNALKAVKHLSTMF